MRNNGDGCCAATNSKPNRQISGKDFLYSLFPEILDPHSLEAYIAGRLIPLNKNPREEEVQIRPIGVGDVMRRIVGKAISWCLSDDI